MNPMNAMNCQRARGHLLDHAYHDLPAESAAELQAHLAECPECAGRAAALRQGVFALDQLAKDEETPNEIPTGPPATLLLQALSARHQRQSRRWQTVAACAAVIAVAAIGLAWGRVRIEVSRSHLQIAWGEPPRSAAPELPLDPPLDPPPAPVPLAERDQLALRQVEQLREQLADQTKRLDDLEQLASLAGQQTLQTDDRLTAAVNSLAEAFHAHRRRTESELADLREIGEIRWQLIHHEQREREADLLTRAATAAE